MKTEALKEYRVTRDYYAEYMAIKSACERKVVEAPKGGIRNENSAFETFDTDATKDETEIIELESEAIRREG